MKLIKIENEITKMFDCDTYSIQENGEIGGLELEEKEDEIYIEHVTLLEQYQGKGYLRKIIDCLKTKGKNITCLPLKQYRAKFEHLGFKYYTGSGDDLYYKLQNTVSN